jgi:hypothetical protein
MEWTPLTAVDLESSMTSREREDFGRVAASYSLVDRAAPMLCDLVAEIRGYIATWSPNTLSAAVDLIPPSFKAKALSIARWRLLITVPGYQPGEARKLDFEKADAFFNKVAEGKIRPEPADDAVVTAVPSEKPSGVEIVSGPPRRTGRVKMDGI